MRRKILHCVQDDTVSVQDDTGCVQDDTVSVQDDTVKNGITRDR